MKSTQVTAVLLLLVRLIGASSVASNSTGRLSPTTGAANKTVLAETLEAAPTVTSVHQIWTSSSSGSLDELSPEMISKMRNDVPFLAAYALRPRLVGASQQVTGNNMISESEGDMLRTPTKQLQTSASSIQLARQQKPNSSSVTKLGDFSEFNVETQSTSKSEHHHKRRTTLKRKPDEFRRKILADASRIVKLKRSKQSRSAQKKGAKQNTRTARRSGKGSRSSKKSTRSKLLRAHPKRARYFLEEEGEMKDLVDKSTTLPPTGDDSGVKGGKSSPTNKQPFHAKGKGSSVESPPNDLAEPTTSKTTGDETDDEKFEEAPIDDELSEPRRVGDGDVDEEEGDTVLVEPKSDGIDDDPEIPVHDDDEGQAAGGGGSSSEGSPTQPRTSGENEPDGSGSGGTAETEERGNRVNRERPNPSGGSEAGSATGGGVGATIGGGGSGSGEKTGAGRNEKGEDDDNDDDDDDDVERQRPKSGVELADDADRQRGGSSADDSRGAADGSSDSDQDDAEFGNRRPTSSAGGRNGGDDKADDALETSGRRSKGDSGGRSDQDSDDETELRRIEGGGKESSRPTDKTSDAKDDADKKSGRSEGERCADDGSYKPHDEKFHDAHHQTSDWLRGSIPGEPNEDYPTLSRVNRSTDFRCSDQKHAGFYADVESRCQIFHICQPDGRQDSFLCPNGTIFSQKTLVCVWWNGFDCEDAPKLYHLNALLYKSTRGKDSPQAAAVPLLGGGGSRSDDAAALGGIGSGDGAPTMALRPRDEAGGPRQTIKPRGMTTSLADRGNTNGPADAADDEDYAAADEESSLDGLVKAMRRKSGGEMSAIDGNNSLAPDDEATIQRKSTGGAAANLSAAESARLRRLRRAKAAAAAIPRRRRRRASVRQAPPRLKSRRVSSSRKRKQPRLRHVIKPKRRA